MSCCSHDNKHYVTIYLRIGLALAVGLILAACNSGKSSEDVTGTPVPTATPWPTLAPVATIQPTDGSAAEAEEAVGEEVEAEAEPEIASSGPQLIDQFRASLRPDAISIFPLEGHIDHPVRIEVIVLSGEVDPAIILNTAEGDRLALSNNGETGQPEVIGQFQFPGDGFYELGITTLNEPGEVGVSVYELEPAQLEGGGNFSSTEEQLFGTIEHPASYHTFRVPLERGQRIDLYAEALSPELDLLFEVYSPQGVLLEARDDNVGTDPYLWNYLPNQSGVYTIVLSNFDEGIGDYVLTVKPSEPGLEAVIGTRTEIELMAAPRISTWLTVEGTALDAVRVEARPVSPGVDLQISIYDPFGNRLTIANQFGIGEPEQLTTVQFPFDGIYQIEFLTLEEGGVIEYFIRPRRSVDIEEGGLIIPGRFGHEGEIVGPGTVFSYVFDAQADDLIGIDAHATGGTGLDLGFDLYTPDGELLLSRDDVVGKDPVMDGLELPESGRYALALWNFGGTTGPYDIFITDLDAPATAPDQVPPTGDGE